MKHTLFRRVGTLYVGVSNEIARRTWEHKNDFIERSNSGWNDLYDKLMGEIALPDLPGSPSPRIADAMLGRG